MSPLELTSFITALANFIACEVTDDDSLGLVGAAITQLGDTITTISLQRALCEKNQSKDDGKSDC